MYCFCPPTWWQWRHVKMLHCETSYFTAASKILFVQSCLKSSRKYGILRHLRLGFLLQMQFHSAQQTDMCKKSSYHDAKYKAHQAVQIYFSKSKLSTLSLHITCSYQLRANCWFFCRNVRMIHRKNEPHLKKNDVPSFCSVLHLQRSKSNEALWR